MPDLPAAQPPGSFLRRYLEFAPLALAIERTFECEILSKQEFVAPILDVGCGDGIFSRILFGARQVDVGIDLNLRELVRAREVGNYRALMRCRGERLPLGTASFKTVFSNSVLEHIPDIGPVLTEVRRVLVPGGAFYATVPSELFEHYSLANQLLEAVGLRGAAARFRTGFNSFWAHYHCHDRKGWEQLFQAAGFEVVAHQEYCPRRVCLLNDSLVPVALPSLVMKKLLNRWFAFPALRRAFAPLLGRVFESVIDVDPSLKGGGIHFFKLR